jgi:hypothetical protein
MEEAFRIMATTRSRPRARPPCGGAPYSRARRKKPNWVSISSGLNRRASKTLRGITGLKIVEQRVAVENDQIKEFRVRMEVIFVLEE